MSDAEQEIVVAIEPDEVVKSPAEAEQAGGATVEVKKVAETESDDPLEDLKAQFKALQESDARKDEELAATRRRELAARQDAEKAKQETAAVRTEIVDTRLDTITSGMAAASAAIEAAKREIKSFAESGEWEKQAEAYDRLADARAKYGRLDEAKADIEASKTQAAPERSEEHQRTTSVDPVDAYINGRTEPTARWLRDHKDYITDPKKNARLTAAHWDAVGNDISPDTPAYFEHVEKYIGLRRDNANGNGAEQPRKRSAAPIVAPVQGSSGGVSGNGGEVRLSSGEARAATDGTHTWNYDDPSGQKKFKKGDPIGVQEFARRKLAMQKQGLYDRSFVEQ